MCDGDVQERSVTGAGPATAVRDRVLDAIDLLATLVLAIQCAWLGVQSGFDLFGILLVAYLGSVGGAVVRDLLLGEHPPAPLRDWRYAALAATATGFVLALSLAFDDVATTVPPHFVETVEAFGLALAAVAGARKSLDYSLPGTSVVLIATLNACGGGIVRDLLAARPPHVLHADFYATAALLGATVMVILVRRFAVRRDIADLVAASVILVLRFGAIHGDWQLPHLA